MVRYTLITYLTGEKGWTGLTWFFEYLQWRPSVTVSPYFYLLLRGEIFSHSQLCHLVEELSFWVKLGDG